MTNLNISPYMVTHDELTGLPNSFLFYDRLNTNIASAERSTNRFAVLYIKFKGIQNISEEYGKGISGALLIKITERLNDVLREADSIGRLDEFTFGVIVTNVVNKEAVDLLVYRLSRALGICYQINSHSFTFKYSIGISVYPDDAMNATSLTGYAADHVLNYD